MSEALCICGHLTSDHESTGEWPTDKAGSPCNRCNADPAKETRNSYGMYCTRYAEWQIEDIPYPGTWAASEVGCQCDRVENVRRARAHTPPLYDPTCPVHVWVCQRTERCTHRDPCDPVDIYYMNHVGTHATCEHCTVPRIECDQCGKVWGDWRTTPERNGWLHFVVNQAAPNATDFGPDIHSWRCETCQNSQSPAMA